jgi:hypothetical protein
MKIALTNPNNKPLPNLRKRYESRRLAHSTANKAGKSQFHQGELTGQASGEQPTIPGFSRQENILTSQEKKF